MRKYRFLPFPNLLLSTTLHLSLSLPHSPIACETRCLSPRATDGKLCITDSCPKYRANYVCRQLNGAFLEFPKLTKKLIFKFYQQTLNCLLLVQTSSFKVSLRLGSKRLTDRVCVCVLPIDQPMMFSAETSPRIETQIETAEQVKICKNR